ncbi:MAG: OmpH family outer membrane protein [Bacteroidota bacterium]
MRNLILLTLLFTTTISFGQVKIGYTNIELVLAYMPETQKMEEDLQTYQQKLGEQLASKQQSAQKKLDDYRDWATANPNAPEAEYKKKEEELVKLDEELQKQAAQSDYDIITKRQELMAPILEKLQAALDTIAEEGGYTYVLNQTTSAGVSTILFGPEEHDVTMAVMEKLGIEISSGNE